jgi:uncharacterized protein (UPF0297 family)
MEPTIKYSGPAVNQEARRALKVAFLALQAKGYNPVRQLSSYLTSGDLSYITNHNDARTIISGLERDDLIAELVRAYVRDIE